MKLGIIGLTASGKTTLFNSLSKAKGSGDKNISAGKRLNIKIILYSCNFNTKTPNPAVDFHELLEESFHFEMLSLAPLP